MDKSNETPCHHTDGKSIQLWVYINRNMGFCRANTNTQPIYIRSKTPILYFNVCIFCSLLLQKYKDISIVQKPQQNIMKFLFSPTLLLSQFLSVLVIWPLYKDTFCAIMNYYLCLGSVWFAVSCHG